MFVMFSFEKAIADLGWTSGKTYINTIEVLNLRLFHTLKNRIKLSRFKQLSYVTSFVPLKQCCFKLRRKEKYPTYQN